MVTEVQVYRTYSKFKEGNMKQIVVISETETDIHVRIEGDNINILRGIALILKEMDANGFPLSSILEYIKSEVQYEHN